MRDSAAAAKSLLLGVVDVPSPLDRDAGMIHLLTARVKEASKAAVGPLERSAG